MNPRNTGEALLLKLRALGVDYFFANPGTEFASVLRGFADLPAAEVPRPVLAPHEFQAVSMAYGCYLANGRPQAVMTHANVGAANALIGLIGAARMNIPLIFISGMTARNEDGLGRRDKLIHWAQDSRDQGAMFRDYVKWDIEVTAPADLEAALDRAFVCAMSEPRGPVAVKIARGVLMDEHPTALRLGPTPVIAPPAADPASLEILNVWLKEARRPMIIANRLRGIETELLTRASEKHGFGVLTPEDFYVSFPGTHPNHLGYRPNEALKSADLVIALDCETPWYPLASGPRTAKVAHVGPDPLFAQIPARGHSGDLYLTASVFSFLKSLNELKPHHRAERDEWIRASKRFDHQPASEELNARTVSRVVAPWASAETPVINELGLLPEAFAAAQPGTYFRSGSASPLGWGMGCALGLALARPHSIPLAAVGDGVFLLSPALGAFETAARLGKPFVTLILDNGGLRSIADTTRTFYDKASPGALTEFAEDVIYEKSVEMVGGLARSALSPNELEGALKEAFAFCKSRGRPAAVRARFKRE